MALINSNNFFPLKSTVPKSFTDLTSTSYEHFGLLSVNPTNGHVILMYRKGTVHVGDYGIIIFRHSIDGGAHWGDELSLPEFTENEIDLRNLGGGYNSDGKLFIFYTRYSPDKSSFQSMNYRYSDNDGTSWSNLQTLPILNNSGYSPYGHIVDAANNPLYQTWYGINGDIYSVCLYKLTASSDNFSVVNKVVYSGQIKCTESSMINLGGGCFIILSRLDDGTTYRQFKSEDNCETWTDQGNTNFDSWPEGAGNYEQAPPFLSYIDYQGIGIIACYYTVREMPPMLSKLKVVYGLAEDLLNGVEGWKAPTINVIHEYKPGIAVGYQSFFHPLNKFKGLGVTFESNGSAYPVIKFTKTEGILKTLTTLGM